VVRAAGQTRSHSSVREKASRPWLLHEDAWTVEFPSVEQRDAAGDAASVSLTRLVLASSMSQFATAIKSSAVGGRPSRRPSACVAREPVSSSIGKMASRVNRPRPRACILPSHAMAGSRSPSFVRVRIQTRCDGQSAALGGPHDSLIECPGLDLGRARRNRADRLGLLSRRGEVLVVLCERSPWGGGGGTGLGRVYRAAWTCSAASCGSSSLTRISHSVGVLTVASAFRRQHPVSPLAFTVRDRVGCIGQPQRAAPDSAARRGLTPRREIDACALCHGSWARGSRRSGFIVQRARASRGALPVCHRAAMCRTSCSRRRLLLLPLVDQTHCCYARNARGKPAGVKWRHLHGENFSRTTMVSISSGGGNSCSV